MDNLKISTKGNLSFNSDLCEGFNYIIGLKIIPFSCNNNHFYFMAFTIILVFNMNDPFYVHICISKAEKESF